MGEGHHNGFKSPADGILELLGNLHPFSLRDIVEVIYDQDQILFPVIFYDLILGQGKGFLFGVFIAGAGNLLFGRKLWVLCNRF